MVAVVLQARRPVDPAGAELQIQLCKGGRLYEEYELLLLRSVITSSFNLGALKLEALFLCVDLDRQRQRAVEVYMNIPDAEVQGEVGSAPASSVAWLYCCCWFSSINW